MANRTVLLASGSITTDYTETLAIGWDTVFTVSYTKVYADTALEVHTLGHSTTDTDIVGGAGIVVNLPGGLGTNRYRLGSTVDGREYPLSGSVVLTNIPAGNGSAGIAMHSDRTAVWQCRDILMAYREALTVRIFERP